MQLHRWLNAACATLAAGSLSLTSANLATADVKAGDTITKDNMAQAADLLIPSMKWYVEHGMPMKIIDYKKIEWPKAYKEATEKYSGQVKLSPDGRDMFNYVAGAPFPKIDAAFLASAMRGLIAVLVLALAVLLANSWLRRWIGVPKIAPTEDIAAAPQSSSGSRCRHKR